MRASKGVTRFKSSAAGGRKRVSRLGGAAWKWFAWRGLRRGKKAGEACERFLGKLGFCEGVRRVLAAWDLARPRLSSVPPRRIAGATRQCTHRWVTVHGNVWGGSATNGR